ncbi:MAG TPA: undecaprenyl-diphosphate phosphatase [Vicinamibacterales bacterium]|nr:undecaprenyl-diphosphate phosphatase [Vicinamibacterales bacterium]
MEFFNAALLGVVQGLTEFLPISSTAHLILGARMLGFQDPGGVFTVMIQLGAILAVIWLYRAKVLSVVLGLPTQPEARRFAALLLIGFLPALVSGALFSDYITQVLYYSPRVIAAAFILGGVVMLLVERMRARPTVTNIDSMPFSKALAVGVAQMLALVPGVSRSGATIVGGLLSGLDRTTAAEFSFFLSMPTMTAAFVHGLWGVRHDLSTARAGEIGIGFVMAFIAALLVVRPFLRYVGRSGFAPFAWYRISVGAALALAIAAGWL